MPGNKYEWNQRMTDSPRTSVDAEVVRRLRELKSRGDRLIRHGDNESDAEGLQRLAQWTLD